MIIPFSPPKSIVVAQWLEEMDRIKAMKGRVADAPPVWLEEDAAEARVESPPVRNVVWRGGEDMTDERPEAGLRGCKGLGAAFARNQPTPEAVKAAAEEIQRLWVEQQPEVWLYEVGGVRYYHPYRHDYLYTADGGETFVKGVPLYRRLPEDEEVHILKAEIQKLKGQIDALLAHCPNDECMECSKIVCPHGEPLHLHHDGCPACAHFAGDAP